MPHSPKITELDHSFKRQSENTLPLVIAIMGELSTEKCSVLLGGGWAKELLGLIRPRVHKDIDLYYLGTDLSPIDSFIAAKAYKEIQAKHMAHKRAFLANGVMVEIVLIQQDNQGHHSPFSPWGDVPIRWPQPLSAEIEELGISCLSSEALNFYTY